MRLKPTLILTGLALTAATSHARTAEASGRTSMTIFDHAVFYDGYLLENNPDKDLSDGILRHSTYLYAVRLQEEELAKIGRTLEMDISVTALCDNYDRIGNINLAFTPKGAGSYAVSETTRIELGRFITPFMNKNKQPDTVPYHYDISNVSEILRDASLRETFDIWVEFELFGIPYAANEQIAGCKDRNDVFEGTLRLTTDAEPAPLSETNVLVPIVIKNPEYIGKNFNNYSEEATDELGKAVKTYTFTVPRDVTDSQMVLVMSNHGANSGGEEYNRRAHFIYFDDKEVHQFIPGRTSCEPFRQYNTQPNGIYGMMAKTDKSWQSFSNWCPGDVIDTRIINLGALPAGEHALRISVPDARFAGGQGDFPVSLYFQGTTEGTLTPNAVAAPYAEPRIKVWTEGKDLCMESGMDITSVSVYNAAGECLYTGKASARTDLGFLGSGIYIATFSTSAGDGEAHRITIP